MIVEKEIVCNQSSGGPDSDGSTEHGKKSIQRAERREYRHENSNEEGVDSVTGPIIMHKLVFLFKHNYSLWFKNFYFSYAAPPNIIPNSTGYQRKSIAKSVYFLYDTHFNVVPPVHRARQVSKNTLSSFLSLHVCMYVRVCVDFSDTFQMLMFIALWKALNCNKGHYIRDLILNQRTLWPHDILKWVI